MSDPIDTDCENCGAEMSWSPEADALLCSYCDTRREVPPGEGVVLERSLDEAEGAARGFGLEVRAVRCDNCGATVALEGSATADLCVYCGSPEVLAQEANRNAIRPESLIPLDVGRAAVDENLDRWLKGLWFRPGDFKKKRKYEAVGVYVPYWTFDCRVTSYWWAESGTYYWVTETYTTKVGGKTVTRTRRVRKTRWRPASGSRQDAYDDLLVPASGGLSKKLLDRLGAFDTRALVPYRPEYLAGWRAEEYRVDLAEGWSRGEAEVVESQRGRCARDVPGDTYRNLQVRNMVRDVRWKHVLLPIWSLSYPYRGKVYPVLIHGQTGKVVGEAPLSVLKILLAIAIVAAVVLGGYFLLAALAS